MAVWLANYFTAARGQRTAVLEWNDHGDFEHMEQICTGRADPGKIFRVMKVDYFKQAGMKELIYCRGKQYQQIIIDFGQMTPERFLEWERSDQKLLLVSLSEWCLEACLEFFQEKRKVCKKGWHCAVVFGSDETRRQLCKKTGLEIGRIPFSVDAFAIDRKAMKYLEQFD